MAFLMGTRQSWAWILASTSEPWMIPARKTFIAVMITYRL